MQSSSTMSLGSRGPQLRMRNSRVGRFSGAAGASSSTQLACRGVVPAPAVSRSFGSSRRALAVRAFGQGVAHPGEVRLSRMVPAWPAWAQKPLHANLLQQQPHDEPALAPCMHAHANVFTLLQEAYKGGAQQPLNAQLSVPAVTMAKGGGGGGGGNFGSGSSLSMVMERSKLEFVMPTPPQQAPKLDDGGSGGDDGKHNHHGGGGGDGDGGDDDDYFGGEGDGEGDGQGAGGGGDGFFRTALPELYDRLTIGAVLQEWYKTVAELPLFIRRAVEMGLFSSAQLVRFLSMDVRPGVARSVSRTLPAEVSRGCLSDCTMPACCCFQGKAPSCLGLFSALVMPWCPGVVAKAAGRAPGHACTVCPRGS